MLSPLKVRPQRKCLRIEVDSPELVQLNVQLESDATIQIPQLEISMPSSFAVVSSVVLCPVSVSSIILDVLAYVKTNVITMNEADEDRLRLTCRRLEAYGAGMLPFTMLIYDKRGSCSVDDSPSVFVEPFTYVPRIKKKDRVACDVVDLENVIGIRTEQERMVVPGSGDISTSVLVIDSIEYHCDGCQQKIPPVKRYHCQECENFDYCFDCYICNGARHNGHEMYRMKRHMTAIRAKICRTKGGVGFVWREMMRSFYNLPCVGIKGTDPVTKKEQYVYISYGQMYKRTLHFARGVCALLNDVSTKNLHVAICAVNSVEWMLSDFMCALVGAVVIPIHTHYDIQSAAEILAASEATVLMCDKSHEERFKAHFMAVDRCPLILMIVIDPTDQTTEQENSVVNQSECRILVHSFRSVEKLGETHSPGPVETTPESTGSEPTNTRIADELILRSLQKEAEDELAVKDDGEDVLVHRVDTDLVSLSYTSGSTGAPKGVMHTQGHVLQDLTRPTELLHDPFVSILYRPFAYASDRERYWLAISFGGRVAIFNGSMDNLVNECRLIQPSSFSGPPRIWNLLYSEFIDELTQRLHAIPTAETDTETSSQTGSLDLSYLPEHLSELMSEHGSAGQSILQEALDRFGSCFGSRCISISYGSAPSREEVKRWANECFRGKIAEGYGLVECGTVTINDKVIPGVSVLLESVPELGYTLDDLPYPRGEILVKTPLMTTGYYKDSVNTNSLFDEKGWLHTGDIGEMYGPSLVRVIDRKKNFFKLAQGEYVSPEKLENIFNQSRYVTQVFVYGHGLWESPLAVVVLTKTVVNQWIESHSDLPKNEMFDDSELKNSILYDFRLLAQKAEVPSYQQPIGMLIYHEPFSVENGLLTVSLKLNRVALQNQFKSDLMQLYSSMLNQESIVQTSLPDSQVNSQVDSVTDRVHSLIKSTLNVPSLDLSRPEYQAQSVCNLGADSITVVALQSRIRRLFGTTIPIAKLWHTPVNQVVESIQREWHPNQKAASTEEVYDLVMADLSLDSALLEQPLESPTSNGGSTHSVLVTGGTGFLGAFLIQSLSRLNKGEFTIYCLVRSEAAESARNRLFSHLQQMNIVNGDFTAAFDLNRLVILHGELSLPDFGLSHEVYHELTREIESIYHCGAEVNHVYPYSELRASNVMGTLEVIKFASLRRRKYIHFISTVETALLDSPRGSYVDTEYRCERLSRETCATASGYRLSKWVGESLLAQSVANHQKGPLSVTVIRPSLVSWDSQHGVGNHDDWLVRFCRGVVSSTVAPEISSDNGCVDVAPVDWVADSVVHLATQHESTAEKSFALFALINFKESFCVKKVLQFIADSYARSTPFEWKPYHEWVAHLKQLRVTDRSKVIQDAVATKALAAGSILSGLQGLFSVLHLFEDGFPNAWHEQRADHTMNRLGELAVDRRLSVNNESVQKFVQWLRSDSA
eukprot:GILJ01010005.1.p1 GENE.GILJ01010005.1~~GILJ01010005.1.p1  ORF type:complete len:1447 (+),score=224.00 GILJ01010005.1:51-4391(+)